MNSSLMRYKFHRGINLLQENGDFIEIRQCTESEKICVVSSSIAHKR